MYGYKYIFPQTLVISNNISILYTSVRKFKPFLFFLLLLLNNFNAISNGKYYNYLVMNVILLKMFYKKSHPDRPQWLFLSLKLIDSYDLRLVPWERVTIRHDQTP